MISEGSMHQYGSKHLGILSMSLSLKPPEVAVGLGAAVTSARTRSQSFQELRMFSQLSLFLLSLAFLLQHLMTFLSGEAKRPLGTSPGSSVRQRPARSQSIVMWQHSPCFCRGYPLIVGWEFSTKNKKNMLSEGRLLRPRDRTDGHGWVCT